MQLTYVFAALVTIPCRFNLKRYPFGTQFCKIAFWAENAYVNGNGVFLPNMNNATEFEEVNYTGKKSLGEFLFKKAISYVAASKRMAVVKIDLQTLYGFHLLNSFTPSILILGICYASLFFPISDFNERVMVSLTALLVLAALFTQASESSVRTPYFKFLDIWYVVLVGFCFLIVLFHTFVHKLRLQILPSEQISKRYQGVDKEDGNHEHKMIETRILFYNQYAKIAFAFIFLAFLTLYCLGAAEIV